MKLEPHPLAKLFPPIPRDEFAAIVADVKAKGCVQPILTFEGKVLDGWHRYQACAAAKVEPVVNEWKGTDPLGFVISMNIMRRHLTPEQRAMTVALAAREMGILRQPNAPGDFGGRPPKEGKPVHGEQVSLIDPRAVEASANVSAPTARRAVRIASKAPDLARKILAGKIGTVEAMETVSRREGKSKPKPPLPAKSLPASASAVVRAIQDARKVVPFVRKAIRAGNLDPKTHYPLLVEWVDGIIEAWTDLRRELKEVMR